jgi:hypothetical protein
MMKRKHFFTFPALFFLLMMASPVKAQFATREEAKRIAEKWIQITIDEYGDWNGSSSAGVGNILDFTSNNRLLGYFCRVNPSGYIIVSNRKELAAVKAYSSNSALDPEDQGGLTALLKSCMLGVIETIESKLGPIEQVTPAAMGDILEINYASCWDYLENYRKGTFPGKSARQVATGNYQEGEVLLSSIWHQFPPYNNYCPYDNCTTTTNGRKLVGCVATAGAQIMKYWNWPPNGIGSGYDDPYDWVNMPDSVSISSNPAKQAAVAELNYEIGVAVEMDFGCNSSGANTDDMTGVYADTYRYASSIDIAFRMDYWAEEWFNLMRAHINMNRLIQYRIPGHSIVLDGWKIVAPLIRQYHMNYGWMNNAYNTWYTVDALHLGDPANEFMLVSCQLSYDG